jgi:hypothetical protein
LQEPRRYRRHTRRLLKQQGLTAHQYAGIVTKQLHESFGLIKTRQKDAQTFSSRAVDA